MWYSAGCLVAFLSLTVILPNYSVWRPTPVGADPIQPNIVMILLDDARMSDLQYMPKTQELLVEKGITFTNSFVNFPLCCPSRASLLTGQAAHNTGIISNVAPNGGWLAFQQHESNTLPVWLAQAGYDKLGFVGKYLNGYSGTSIPAGWTHWRSFSGVPDYYNYTMNILGVLKSYYSNTWDYSTDVIRDFAKNFIKYQASATGTPIFAFISTYAPHGNSQGGAVPAASRHLGLWTATPGIPGPGIPMPKPPSFNESDISDKPAYMQSLATMAPANIEWVENHWRQRLESLQAADDLVQWVVNSLEGKGVLDNTVIIFTSDNGFMLGEHRYRYGKSLPHEESIQVPLVIRGPGIPAGEIRTQLVNNLDVAASIVDWADATPGRVLDGVSLLPLLANPETPWRTALLIQGTSGGNATSLPLWGTWKGIRTNRYMLARHISTNGSTTEYEYYDLLTDPYQLNNNPNSPVVPTLISILNAIENCAGPNCWVTTPEP